MLSKLTDNLFYPLTFNRYFSRPLHVFSISLFIMTTQYLTEYKNRAQFIGSLLLHNMFVSIFANINNTLKCILKYIPVAPYRSTMIFEDKFLEVRQLHQRIFVAALNSVVKAFSGSPAREITHLCLMGPCPLKQWGSRWGPGRVKLSQELFIVVKKRLGLQRESCFRMTQGQGQCIFSCMSAHNVYKFSQTHIYCFFHPFQNAHTLLYRHTALHIGQDGAYRRCGFQAVRRTLRSLKLNFILEYHLLSECFEVCKNHPLSDKFKSEFIHRNVARCLCEVVLDE